MFLVLPRRAEHWRVLVAVVFFDVLSAVDARAAAVAVAAASVEAVAQVDRGEVAGEVVPPTW